MRVLEIHYAVKEISVKYVDILIRKTREKTNPVFSTHRRKKLNNTDFSIISNNCWAGSVYRYFGLPYMSPTAGLYFFADDYIRFISRLHYYLSMHPVIVPAEQSKHYAELVTKHEEDVLVGKIEDVEIIFLHYHSAEEALTKWVRRSSRINWNNLFIKFSQMNNCSDEHIRDFDSIPFHNKICFTAQDYPKYSSCIKFPGYEHSLQVENDTDRFNKCLNVIDWLNNVPEKYILG